MTVKSVPVGAVILTGMLTFALLNEGGRSVVGFVTTTVAVTLLE